MRAPHSRKLLLVDVRVLFDEIENTTDLIDSLLSQCRPKQNFLIAFYVSKDIEMTHDGKISVRNLHSPVLLNRIACSIATHYELTVTTTRVSTQNDLMQLLTQQKMVLEDVMFVTDARKQSPFNCATLACHSVSDKGALHPTDCQNAFQTLTEVKGERAIVLDIDETTIFYRQSKKVNHTVFNPHLIQFLRDVHATVDLNTCKIRFLSSRLAPGSVNEFLEARYVVDQLTADLQLWCDLTLDQVKQIVVLEPECMGRLNYPKAKHLLQYRQLQKENSCIVFVDDHPDEIAWARSVPGVLPIKVESGNFVTREDFRYFRHWVLRPLQVFAAVPEVKGRDPRLFQKASQQTVVHSNTVPLSDWVYVCK